MMEINQNKLQKKLQKIKESNAAGRVEVVDAVDGRGAMRVFQEPRNIDIKSMDILMPGSKINFALRRTLVITAGEGNVIFYGSILVIPLRAGLLGSRESHFYTCRAWNITATHSNGESWFQRAKS